MIALARQLAEAWRERDEARAEVAQLQKQLAQRLCRCNCHVEGSGVPPCGDCETCEVGIEDEEEALATIAHGIAVKAEREACARIANEVALYHLTYKTGSSCVASNIAAAILARGGA